MDAVTAIIALVHERDEIVARIACIDAELAAFATIPAQDLAQPAPSAQAPAVPGRAPAPRAARTKRKQTGTHGRVLTTRAGKSRCEAVIDSILVRGPTHARREDAEADLAVALDVSRTPEDRRAALRANVRVYAFRLTPEQRSEKASGAATRRWSRQREARDAAPTPAPSDPPSDPLPSRDLEPLARRNGFVAGAFPLVEKVARRLARRLPAHVELDDLISSGVVGLMDAAARFDPARLERFEGFAEFRIRGAILDGLRESDSLSRDMRRLSNQLRDATRGLESQLGRAPAPDEIAGRLGISVDELYAHQRKLSGSSVVGIDDAGPDLLDRFSDDAAVDPFEMSARREIVARLTKAIEGLPGRQKKVMSLIYFDDLRMWEVGKILGVTESRVCQIHADAVRRLRDDLGQEFAGEVAA